MTISLAPDSTVSILHVVCSSCLKERPNCVHNRLYVCRFRQECRSSGLRWQRALNGREAELYLIVLTASVKVKERKATQPQIYIKTVNLDERQEKREVGIQWLKHFRWKFSKDPNSVGSSGDRMEGETKPKHRCAVREKPEYQQRQRRGIGRVPSGWSILHWVPNGDGWSLIAKRAESETRTGFWGYEDGFGFGHEESEHMMNFQKGI